MIVRKVLNIEDSPSKHVAVRRALERCGVPYVDHADMREMVEKVKNM